MTARLSNDEVVDRTLETLRSGRVATAEVLVRDALSGSVETKDGAIEVVTARGERGLGVRVLDGQRIGFAHTSDLAVSGIEACVDQARRMATITEPDQDLRIATAPLESVDLDIYEPGLEDRPLADRGAIALAVERAARTADPRITHFRKTNGYANMPLDGLIGALAVYSEFRRRRFRPEPTEDHIFRCQKCGFVYTDDADVDRSRCSQCGRLNDVFEF